MILPTLVQSGVFASSKALQATLQLRQLQGVLLQNIGVSVAMAGILGAEENLGCKQQKIWDETIWRRSSTWVLMNLRIVAANNEQNWTKIRNSTSMVRSCPLFAHDLDHHRRRRRHHHHHHHHHQSSSSSLRDMCKSLYSTPQSVQFYFGFPQCKRKMP